MSCQEPDKIIVYECLNGPPKPPVIAMKGLISRGTEFDRETLIKFCQAMIENLPPGNNREFFESLKCDLK